MFAKDFFGAIHVIYSFFYLIVYILWSGSGDEIQILDYLKYNLKNENQSSSLNKLFNFTFITRTICRLDDLNK